MAEHNDLGRQGEALAHEYLRKKGYEILDENWVNGKAEIDLIAYYERMIVFIEVKTRSSIGFGFPEDFVDKAKEQRIGHAADAYIDLMNHEGEVRFDIISILFNQHHTYTINHIEDAFWPS